MCLNKRIAQNQSRLAVDALGWSINTSLLDEGVGDSKANLAVKTRTCIDCC
jgi:hypothetical protein